MIPGEQLRVYGTYQTKGKKYWIVDGFKGFGYTEFRNYMANERSYSEWFYVDNSI